MENGPIEFVQFMHLFERLGDGWPALVVLGLFAGVLVRAATASSRHVGLLSSCLLGIAGAFLGVAVAAALGIALPGPGSRFLAAVAGSLVLALLGGQLARSFRRPPPAPP